MSSDFKDLNLDRTRLKECVEEFWEENNVQPGVYSELTNSRHRVKYDQDNCNVIVDFLFIQNGTTTIHTRVGKHPEKGEQLALYLKDKLVFDSRKSICVSVKSISQEIFDLLLEFLQELKNEDSDVAEITVVLNSENTVQKSIKATSKYNDSLTLTHYRTTSTLLLQGKPLYVYSQASYFLAKFTDLNGFLAIVYKGEADSKPMDVDKNTIEADLRSLLPSAYSNLGEGLLTMLRTSYMLKDISLSLPDYSCYVFPALRALEGVMRKLLFNAGYSIEENNNNSFGGIFYRNANMKYCVNSASKQRISNDKLCHALEHCYNYFVQQRHSLFHANDFTDGSRFIEKKEHAAQIIEKVIQTIDTAYKITS